MTDEETLSKVKEFYKDGETGLNDRFKRMKRCQDFKIGKQWEHEVEEHNKARGRHSLTINRILPVINDFCGMQIQNRKDIKVHPIKRATHVLAKIFTALAKHALDTNQAEYEKSEVFEDGTTTGAGWFWIKRDYSSDPLNGDLVIEKANPFRVIPDPNIKEYNANKTGKFIHYYEYVNKDKLEAEYPDKKDELVEGGFGAAQDVGTFGKIVGFLFKGSSQASGYDDVEGDPQSNQKKYQYRLINTFWKEWKPCVYIYDRNESELEPFKSTDKSIISRAKKLKKRYPDRFDVKEQIAEVLHHTKWCGNVLLEDIVNPFADVNQQQYYDLLGIKDDSAGVTMFPLIPYYPYHVNGYAFGVVENLIGPQEEHNWARSQVLNIINKIPNVGWIVGKITGAKARRALEDYDKGEAPVLEKDEFGNFIEKIKSTDLPRGHELIAQRSAQDIKEIANPPIETPETEKKQLSGYAIALRQTERMRGSAKIFSNWEYSLRILGILVVELIRRCGIYSDEEIKAVVDESDLIDQNMLNKAAGVLSEQGIEAPQPPAELASVLEQAKVSPEMAETAMLQIREEMQLYQQAQQEYSEILKITAEQMVLDELKDLTKGRYGIKVDESSFSPTYRIAQFIEVLELNKALVESSQPGVPRETLIDASDVAHKEEIKAFRGAVA